MWPCKTDLPVRLVQNIACTVQKKAKRSYTNTQLITRPFFSSRNKHTPQSTDDHTHPCDEFREPPFCKTRGGTQPKYWSWKYIVDICPETRRSANFQCPRFPGNELDISPKGVCYLACHTVTTAVEVQLTFALCPAGTWVNFHVAGGGTTPSRTEKAAGVTCVGTPSSSCPSTPFLAHTHVPSTPLTLYTTLRLQQIAILPHPLPVVPTLRP